MLPLTANEDEDSFLNEVKSQKQDQILTSSSALAPAKRSNVLRTTAKQPVKVTSRADNSNRPSLMRQKSKETQYVSVPEMPSMDERYQKIREFRMAWHPRIKGNSAGGFVVDSKEGRSCVYFENVCYMYGGYSPSYEQAYLQGYNLTTKKIFDIKSKITKEPQPRAYHTCTLLDDNMLIFGGEVFSMHHESRMLTNDIYVFSLRGYEYTKANIHENIEPRKYHAACMLGSHLVVYGGVDEENRVLNQLMTINFSKQTDIGGVYIKPRDIASYRFMWKKAPLDTELEGLSNHTMTEVYSTPQKGLVTASNKNRPVDLFETKRILIEGLYIFGGLNKKSEYVNTLTIIDTSTFL